MSERLSHPIKGPNRLPVLSYGPLFIAAPDRGQDLELRVSAPSSGTHLPLILFAHGFGSSSDGYAPLVEHWTRQGFVVIQPTFLDSTRIGLFPQDPRTPLIWRHRVADMVRILDHLDAIEAQVPGLEGLIDRARIAAVGHSYGAQTVGMLLGARVIDSEGGPGPDLSDPRVKAGVLLCATGLGGSDLSALAAQHFPFMNPSFAEMMTPCLVVAGDRDDSPLSVRGPDWFTDAYRFSPGAAALLTLHGGEHMLGGISGYGVTATTDESPERVEAVRSLSLAFLRSALDREDPAWPVACRAFAEQPDPPGRIDHKSGSVPVVPG